MVADADKYPVLIHCAHGKDRTGLAAALILACAGVPDEAIVADYVASLEGGGVELCRRDLVRASWLAGVILFQELAFL